MGVITSFMVVELNNVNQQEHKRCKYVMEEVPFPHSFWLFHVWCFWWVSASYDIENTDTLLVDMLTPRLNLRLSQW